jgi:hypothetical protein
MKALFFVWIVAVLRHSQPDFGANNPTGIGQATRGEVSFLESLAEDQPDSAKLMRWLPEEE